MFRGSSFGGDWDDDPLDDTWNKWVVGLAVPIGLALLGLSKFIWPHAVLYGSRGRSLTLTGWDAVLYGAAFLGAALFLHARFHWALTKRLAPYADLGKVLGLIVGIVAVGSLIVRNMGFP